MQASFDNFVLSATGAEAIEDSEIIQSLWSNYGQIVRLRLIGGAHSSVILKHVKIPPMSNHPRGWNTSLSHQRKIRSYQVEAHWYQHYAEICQNDCQVPVGLAVKSLENETILLMTDLDAAGFDVRKNTVNMQDIHACLAWLASFHATFINRSSPGLWECGTYWHLKTRPDELAALTDHKLRQAAPLIDQKLQACRYQTLVHGDAKLANFCFQAQNTPPNLSRVGAVDFQYVGRGCGMKDVAYFFSSCLNEHECESLQEPLLDYYFSILGQKLKKVAKNVDISELESEWRSMYPFALADFHRFIKGWSPGHWKINSHSERMTRDVIKQLQL